MTTEKEAKAEAKAAKAAAKALRPWFKKKRFWLLGAIAIVVIVVIQGGADSTPTTQSTEKSGTEVESNQQTATEDTVGTGLGSKDASGDIDSVDCGTPDVIGVRYPEVKVTNRSEKTSTYFITLEFESADGGTKYDETTIFITSLESGQTMTEKGFISKDIPEGAVCKITEIQRTAD